VAKINVNDIDLLGSVKDEDPFEYVINCHFPTTTILHGVICLAVMGQSLGDGAQESISFVTKLRGIFFRFIRKSN
jgi:3-hydroxymyristoyl/3-hydroxydecanoyl-(acyl carrier protein) dehydratase